MKNLTLSLDEKVLQQIRRYAADRGTTVNAIVREHLTRIATQEDKAAKARRELVALAKKSSARLGPNWKWNREELYDRPILSGHQRPDLRGGRQARPASKAAPRD